MRRKAAAAANLVPSWGQRQLHGFFFEHLDGTIQNAFGFLAVPRSGVAVIAQHDELESEFLRLALRALAANIDNADKQIAMNTAWGIRMIGSARA